VFFFYGNIGMLNMQMINNEKKCQCFVRNLFDCDTGGLQFNADSVSPKQKPD
jgi:hypothetical protein